MKGDENREECYILASHFCLLPFAFCPLPCPAQQLHFNIILIKNRLTFLKLTGLCILRSNYCHLIPILSIITTVDYEKEYCNTVNELFGNAICRPGTA